MSLKGSSYYMRAHTKKPGYVRNEPEMKEHFGVHKCVCVCVCTSRYLSARI